MPEANPFHFNNLNLSYDDIALTSSGTTDLNHQTEALNATSSKLGLTISEAKSKVMLVGTHEHPQDVLVGDRPLEVVSSFTYLGATITNDGRMEVEISRRLALASASFNVLQPVWKANSYRLQTKLRLLNSNVLSVLLYGCESWSLTKRLQQRILAAENRFLRRLLGITWRDHITNEHVRDITRQPSILDTIKKRRWFWLGHVLRMPDSAPPKQVINLELQGFRHPGRPQLTFKRAITNEARPTGKTWDDLHLLAQDRLAWRRYILAPSTAGGLGLSK